MPPNQPQGFSGQMNWGPQYGSSNAAPVNYNGANMVPQMNFGPQLQTPQVQAPAGYSPSAGGAGSPGNDFSMMQKMFGGTNDDGAATNGWAMPALNTLTGVAGLWMGKQQLDLAKKSLRESRRQFGLNYNSQAKNYNTRLEDRQRARVASNSTGVYESTDKYLNKNRIAEVG